nr:immunoglobulin heavy chain junction region [Macaca mulatta]
CARLESSVYYNFDFW